MEDVNTKDIISKIELIRQKKQVFYYLTLFPGIAMILAAIILFFALENETVPYIGIALFVVGFGILFIAAKIYSNYRNFLLDSIFKEYSKKYYKNAEHNGKCGVSAAYLRDCNFFPHYDYYKGSEYLKASYKEIEFEMSEFDLSESTKDSSYTVDTGIFIRFQLKKSTNHELLIKEDSTKHTHKGLKRAQKIEFESIEFNKVYDVYADDKTFAFYILTPQVMEKFLNAEEKFKGNLVLKIDDDHIYFVISRSKDKLNIRVGQKIDEELINLIINYYTLPIRIIDELNLDNDKLNNKNIGGSL